MPQTPSVAHVGTYPPTRCGIATFTWSLADAMRRSGRCGRTGVVACVDAAGALEQPAEVVCELVAGSPDSCETAASALSEFDLVVLQHEFGIFGGEDGDEVVDLVEQIQAPLLTVLHTVPSRPTPRQREILEQLCGESDAVVVLSRAARTRLLELYDVEPSRVRHIAHGATPNLAPTPMPADPPSSRTVLTWGLIGPGKGIEWGIEAIALLRTLEPRPRYHVVGQTHPKVLSTSGETYRESLLARARALCVGDLVTFEARYLDQQALLEHARQADVILLPYESRDQIVSGVLVEAVSSGKPVVATRFPHAVELLGGGAGLLVPHGDPEAIAAALQSIFTEPGLASRLAAGASAQAQALAWDRIGRAYASLAASIVAARIAARR